MQVKGPEQALKAMQEIPDQRKLETFYLFNALLGELHARLLNSRRAAECFETALQQTFSETEKKLLRKKIEALP